jgi:site-specific DNA-methyltransferase (adenine-specific)
MWERLNKLIKPNGAICLFGSEPFSSALRMSNIKNYKYDWVWDKKKAGNIMLCKYQPMKVTENVMVFNKHNYYPIMELRDKVKRSKCYGIGEAMGGILKDNSLKTYTHRYPKNILNFSNANQKGKVHPTQKPVPLLEYLIRTFTDFDDVVIDCCAGSGTTLLAAKNTGRRAYGFELVKEYVDAFYEKILPCAREDMFTAMARQEKTKQLELTKLLYRKEA